MLTTSERAGNDVRRTLLLSLIPSVGFLVAELVTASFVPPHSPAISHMPALLFVVGFISLFSLLPISAAPAGLAPAAVTGVMTAVALAAGVLVTTSDDAQAGLAIFLVPYVAVPLALLIGLARVTVGPLRRSRHRRGRLQR